MLRLPRLPKGFGQLPGWAELLQRYWNDLCDRIEAQEGSQDTTINRLRRVLSHTNPTTIMTAEDDGATATITIADHLRVYGDGTTLTITGAAESGLASDTVYGVYYDDDTLSDHAPTFVFTTDMATAQAVAADGRHFLGRIKTPTAGSGDTRDGGGVYPIGSNIGGELG